MASMQALDKLKEPKVVLKVRKEDLSVLKESLDSIKGKYKKVSLPDYPLCGCLVDGTLPISRSTISRAQCYRHDG